MLVRALLLLSFCCLSKVKGERGSVLALSNPSSLIEPQSGERLAVKGEKKRRNGLPLLHAASDARNALSSDSIVTDLACGTALFGGAAFVWQTPVFMDSVIREGLQLTVQESIQSSTAIFVSWAIGSTVLGRLADAIGRKPVAVGSGVLAAAHLLLMSHASGFMDLVVARVLGGFVLGGMMQVGFALASESVEGGARKSETSANLHYCGTAVVLLIVAVHQALLGAGIGWRNELRVYALLLGVLLVPCTTLVQESPVYLDLMATRRGARVGGPNAVVEQVASGTRAAGLEKGILAYWRPLALASFAFVAGSTVWYGLGYQAGAISSSLVMNVALLSVLDLPGFKLADMLGQSKIGVRTGASLLFAACGALLLLVALGTLFHMKLATPAAFLGKMCAAGAFQLVCLLPTAWLPDHVRGTGLGICSTSARAAAIVVPTLAHAVPLQTASAACAALALSAASALMLFGQDADAMVM